MGFEKLIYDIKEHYRRLRKSNKVFLHEYKKELITFCVFGCIGGIVAYFAAEIILNSLIDESKITPETEGLVTTFKIAISIVFAVIIGSLYLPYYVYWANKFAFNHLFRIRGDNLNPNFRGTILRKYEDDINRQLSKLASLTKEGEVKADYSTQYFLADLFSANVEQYFWATSFDKPSEFPIRNTGYMRKFNAMDLNGLYDENIPKKARIFITTFDDIIEDIADNGAYLLELIGTHLHYSENQVVGSVRFFISTNDIFTPIEDIVQTAQIEKDKMIYDFYVLDDKLVYGRKNKKLKRTDDTIEISFIGNRKLTLNEVPPGVSIYKTIFQEIWKNSLDIKVLSSHLKNLNNPTEFSINVKNSTRKLAEYQILDEINKKIDRFANDALNLWENIEDTQRKEKRYGSIFDLAKSGQPFFSRWLSIIESSKGVAWAVDSSERKEGNEFYKIWDNNSAEDYEYREFLKASAKATVAGCDLKRIFIIKNLIPKQDEEFFRLFLYKTIETHKLKIGIILSEDTKLTDDAKLNYGDFLIVEISESNGGFNFTNAKGFTLRNKKFKADELSFDFNIMLEKDFGNYQNIFLQLWNDMNTIKFESQADIIDSNKIQKLIQN